MDQFAQSTSNVMGLTFFPQQWKAVSADPGPLLVLAGPGAGKTRCLTGRIGYLIQHHHINPEAICAITFTNKAAQEIAGRLRQSLPDVVDNITLGTIHSLCLQILRKYPHRVGLPSNFAVAGDEHQRLVLSKLAVPSRYQSGLLLRFGKKRLQGDKLHPNDEENFKRYHRELRSNHLIDYDEILQLTRLLLESAPVVLQEFQQRWQHILIDEFQDLDETQYSILKLLAQKHQSIFGVGDDEQSIFAWRGADPRVMARFVEDFNIQNPIVLDINCRCARTIFEMAQKILPTRELTIEKNITALRESSHPVRVLDCVDENEERVRVVKDLHREIEVTGLPKGEFALLYRTHIDGRRWEEALIAEGIPCQLARGQALSDDPVIAQILAALRVVIHPDSELHVEHLASKVFEEALMAEVRQVPGATFSDKLRTYVDENRGGSSRKVCWRFLYQVENLKSLVKVHGNLKDLVQAIFAQGIGQYDNSLETIHEQLQDPQEIHFAKKYGEQLMQTCQDQGQVFISSANGLEIIARIMLQRAMPELSVEYLTPNMSLTENDVILAFQPITFSPNSSMIPLYAGERRLRIIQLFKILQYIESCNYCKLFDEFVTFDTETTGKEVDECDVIELAAVKVREGEIIDTFHSLIYTEKPISKGATEVHGYNNSDLTGSPTLQHVWPEFQKMVEGQVMIAHNGHRFDVPILRRQTESWQGMEDMILFDTLALARSLYPTESLSQENLARRFGIDTGRSHHALDDAQCLAEVFEELQTERLIRARKTCLDNLLDCVALGAAIEDVPAVHPEDQALLDASTWNDLQRYAAIVDAYSEEAEKLGDIVPELDELIQRMTGAPDWQGTRNHATTNQRRSTDALSRLSHLLNSIQAETLEQAVRELLDKVALSTSEGASINQDRVNLLTFHATKGLEFSRLYLLGIEDNQFPGYRALEEDLDHVIREHRRLFYVAMTRAKDKLTLTRCRNRKGRSTGGTLFLDEIGMTEDKRCVSTSGFLA